MRATLIPITLALLATLSCGSKEEAGSIRLSGNIEITEVNVAFKLAGKLVERTVDEGDPVKAGMVLARLDAEQLEAARSREQAALAASESQLTQLRTAIAYQRSSLAAETSLRQAELRAAEARLRELEAGSRQQEIEQARAAVEAARAEHVRASRDWERAQILIKDDDISRAQFDQYRTRYEAAGAALSQAEQAFALVKEGPRREQIDSARAQVSRARAALQLTEAAQLDLKRREQELETRRAEIARSRAQLGIAESQLGDTVVTAPAGGVVLVKSAEVGEILAPGTSILTIGDLDRPWLRGYIGERDLGRVKLGQKVRVTTDSFPGKEYWGKVSYISSQAEFTPKTIQTTEERVKLVYRVKIDIANPRHELKANMPADAEITLP
ncbi:MAG: efflux RND transporter periplasmic adaptor subunit [Bryobacterales bacterium]|nr:efflux RND transporter periplasmic adaptor subunit [Bryobacterales bacterium]